MAGMCGLAQFVTTQVNTDVAVWYCVNSGFLNQPTDRDTFRFHFFNLQPMIRMVKLLGYPIDQGLKAHYLRTKLLLTTLNRFKKMKTNEKKSYKLLFSGLYQCGFFVNTNDLSEKFSMN